MTGTGRWTRPAIALATLLLLGTACANDDGSDSAAGTGSTGTTTTGSTGGDGATASTGSTGDGGGGRYDYGNGGGGNDDAGGDDAGEHDGDGEIALTADNFAFAPTAIEATAGSEILVENANAGTAHTFTVDGTAIDLELSPGDVEDVTIDLDPGAYDFHCRFHASMTGTLTVT